MKKKVNFTLPTLPSTVGHYRFNGNYNDISGNANHLQGINVTDPFTSGISEDGITAIDLENNQYARLLAASAGDFDLGTESFTIEVIFASRVTSGFQAFISKGSFGNGWYLEVDGTGKITVVLDSIIVTTNNGYPGYIYLSIVCISGAALLLYVNGQLDKSVSISTFSDNTTANFNIGSSSFVGSVDEVCISKQAISATQVLSRANGSLAEVSAYQENFLLKMLPAIHHNNADLKEFLISPNTIYNDIKVSAGSVRNIYDYSMTPSSLIPFLTQMFGFELIDERYADESERRTFLGQIVWIYKRKGTLAAIEKIIELLGFTATITEVFSDEIPFVLNQHKLWDKSDYAVISFQDMFDHDLSKWNQPLNLTSWWRISSSALFADGDGTDSDLNGMLFDNTETDYYIETTFAIVSGHGINTEIGIYLRYVDANNWLRLEIITDNSGDDYLVLREKDGTESSTSLLQLTDIDYADGFAHTFWAYVDHVNELITCGFDNKTYIYQAAMNLSINTSSKKGLWVNRGLSVIFGDMKVETLEKNRSAILFDPTMVDRKLQIQLTGSPSYSQNKKDYLAQVLPEYIPFGVDLEFI